MSLAVTEQAIEAAALRICESASLPVGFARELAKAALEAGLPHCRAEGGGITQPERFMDEIDAATVANRWIEDIAYERRGPFGKLEHLNFERRDGGVVLFWDRDRLIAYGLLARDDRNYTVLVRGGPFPGRDGIADKGSSIERLLGSLSE